MKSFCFCMFALALSGAAAGAAGDVAWQGTAGGNLDDVGNWSGEIPTDTSKYADINTLQSAPFTLAGDGIVFPRFRVDSSSWAQKGTNVFDLGAGKSAFAYRFFFKGGAIVHLKSGVMGCYESGDRVFIGDDQDNGSTSYGSNLLIVDGKDAEFRSAGNGDTIAQNSKFIGLGINNANNTIIAKNGGKVTGEVRIGSNQHYSTNNLFKVTGAGSAFNSIGSARRFLVGVVGGFNTAEFLNGAAMNVDGPIYVGTYGIVNGSEQKYGWGNGGNNILRLDGLGTVGTVGAGGIYVGDGASSNKFIVGSGAVLTNYGSLRVGWIPTGVFPSSLSSNLCGNVFEVTAGARVVQGNSQPGSRFYVGTAAYATGNVMRIKGAYCLRGGYESCYIGETGFGNILDVDGGMLCMTNSGNFMVGRHATFGSGSHLVRVANGGLLEHCATKGNFVFYVGYDAPNCRMEIDNATFRLIPCNCANEGEAESHTMSANVALGGASSSAANCTLSCVNGGLLDVGRIVVGDQGPNCTLAITNSTVKIRSRFNIGYNEGAQNSTVILAGTNSTIAVGEDMTLEETSKLVYSFPAKGEIVSPVITCKTLNTDQTPVIKLEVGKGGRNKRSITLIEAVDTINDSVFNRISFDLPEGVAIERTATSIIAHIKALRGTVFTIR